MSTHALPCGCVIQRLSDNIEQVLKMCDCCRKDFSESPRIDLEQTARMPVASLPGHDKKRHWFESNTNGFNDGFDS
jgi:hypothetical protein